MKKNIIENKRHTAKNIRFQWRDKKTDKKEDAKRYVEAVQNAMKTFAEILGGVEDE